MAIRTPPRSVETGDSEAAAIRLQLERLLASPHICHSKRCQSLLKYVVEAYLDGSVDRVKERIIGFEVFERNADYDTNQDSVVRTTAAEVRKRLAQYYLEPGHEHEIRVILPPGAYLPEFRLPVPPAIPKEAGTEIEIAPQLSRPRPRWIVPAGALLLLVFALALWLYPRFGKTDLDRFWAPLLDDRSEAVICVEQPLRIFRFSGSRADDLNAMLVGSGDTPPVPDEARESVTVKLSELTPSGDRYFTYGDLMASAKLAELLARKGKNFQVLGDRLTSYHDLRGRPAILLGQFNNRWTNGLTSGLRYYFDKNMATQTYDLLDRQHPGKILASVPKASRPEEYAIVSRIFDPSTEKTVIAVVGMTFFGTLAGGDFLTQPAYLQDAFHDAPAGWARKNIQVVIKAAVIGGLPGPPKVVTTYFW